LQNIIFYSEHSIVFTVITSQTYLKIANFQKDIFRFRLFKSNTFASLYAY